MSQYNLNFSHNVGEFGVGKSSQVSLIRQELVTLVGHHSRAVVLNQLLYWTQRTKDFSRFVEEERSQKGKQEDTPVYGWIYKTADELVEETLLKVDRTTIRRYLNSLVKQEWIFERSHPQNKWDRTTQYRVNVQKIHKELRRVGLCLSEISLWQLEDDFEIEERTAKREAVSSNVYTLPFRGRNPLKPAEMSNGQNARSNEQIACSNGQNAPSNTETTSEITNKEHTPCARRFFNENLVKEVQEIWKIHIGQEVHLTPKRQQRFSSLLNNHFQNDLSQWEDCCKRIKASPFLMGEGPRGWRVSFDWILKENNLLKILEGNFDSPEAIDQKASNISHLARENKIQSLLASIEDPLWREWCSELDFSLESTNSVSLKELTSIANVRFLEVEDDRLVWIECADKKIMDQIEDLRLKLLSPIQRTYPNVRNLRTCLQERDSAPKRVPSHNFHKTQSTERYKVC